MSRNLTKDILCHFCVRYLDCTEFKLQSQLWSIWMKILDITKMREPWFAPRTMREPRFAARTKNIFTGSRREPFSKLLVARTKNIFTGLRHELYLKIYLWREPKFFSQVRAANHFQKSVCVANQKYFHRFAVQT